MLIKKTLSQANKIKNQIIVIKLSDIIISNEALLTNFAENINLLHANGVRIFIVHEYENIVKIKLQEISDARGVEYSHFGQDKLAELVEMIISGRINRDIITKLCAHAVHAIGMSGKDNHSIIAKKSTTKTPSYKGEPMLVNPEILLTNDSNNIVSVISPVALNEKGRTIILDTSLTASMIATSIGADHLIILSEESHLTQNDITINSILELKNIVENTSELEDNMPEIIAAKSALQHSECLIHFFNANIKDILLLKLFT